MLNNKALQVPYGTRDVLPGEAGARRIIENKLASTFKAWGYDASSLLFYFKQRLSCFHENFNTIQIIAVSQHALSRDCHVYNGRFQSENGKAAYLQEVLE